MKITIITLFPAMLRGFFEESIIKRAVDAGHVVIEVVNLRDYATDERGTVDDRPYGGGAGMVLKVDVINRALNKLKVKSSKLKIKEKVILTSARGSVFNQKKAAELSKLEHIILIAGHYEGVDERVYGYIDEEISIGDFILTGGEIAAAAIVDSVVRLIPGVLKKEDATVNESFFEFDIDELISIVGEHKLLASLKKQGVKKVQLLEYPHYTRPEEYAGAKVPEILKSGDFKKIHKWRVCQAFEETLKKRPDLLTQ